MPELERLTTESWTVVYPSDWEDQSENDTVYFESPEGDKGLYIVLWHMGQEELRSPAELVEVFLATELAHLLDGSDDRELLEKRFETIRDSVVCTWDTLSRENGYWVAGKIVARGAYVLKATFHDYDCENHQASVGFFTPIISSLELREA